MALLSEESDLSGCRLDPDVLPTVHHRLRNGTLYHDLGSVRLIFQPPFQPPFPPSEANLAVRVQHANRPSEYTRAVML